MEVLVFVHEVNARTQYAFDLIFRQILKSRVRLTVDKEEYFGYSGPKFCYRKSPIDKGLFFYSADLLFEKDLRYQNLQVITWSGLRVFFVNENYGALPFDPFAASFYLVSRYEEYVIKQRDAHNRFDANFSIAKRNNFLQVPVVNYYARAVQEILQQTFPNMVFHERQYSFLPTIDIDNAFAYKHKSPLRVVPGIIGSTLKFKFKEAFEKASVYFGKGKDPYDTFDRQILLHDKHHQKPVYFFLLGDLNKYDRNLPYTNVHLQKIVKKIKERWEIGLHPSYYSNKKPGQLAIEKGRLEEIIGKPVTKSRQHYLKMQLPLTYTRLIENGIKEDFSMGYSKDLGFRAGICTPFYFYDLKEEKMTSLLVHSFCVMDSTFKFYMKIRSSELVYTIKPMIDHVKNVKGEMMTVFHNESFGSHKIWKNWGDVYENILRTASSKHV